MRATRSICAVAILAVLLLLLDPGIRATVRRSRPLVLLDNSVSMHATGGLADSAAVLAASLGEVVRFGEAAPAEPGGRTALAEPLTAAISAGRPLVIVTDGEVADVATVPPDLLAQARVEYLPRRPGADVALTDVRMPARLAAGDTLHVAVSPGVVLGSGSRLWESPEELLDRFHRDVVPSPSGVVHHLFWRK